MWWLNSTLLAALTHVGLAWMLVFVDPEKIDRPIQTTIIIETLPAAKELPQSPAKSEVKEVNDRIAPAKIEEKETTKTSGDTEQVVRVKDQDQISNDQLSSEKLESTTENGRIAAIEAGEVAPTPQRADGTLSPASESLRMDAESMIARPSTPVQSQSVVEAIDPQTSPTESIGETETAIVAGKTDRPSTETAQEKPEAPKTVRDRPDNVVSVPAPNVGTGEPTTAVRGKPNDGSEKVAVLRQRPKPIETAKPTKPAAVKTTAPVKPKDTETNLTQKKKFVFPKDTPRLAPTGTKPTKNIPPQRVAAVDGADAASTRNQEVSATTSPQRLQQVAIANPGRPGRVEPDSRYHELLKFLEQGEIEGCATVLPTIARDGSVALSGFAADENLWISFQKSMTDELRVRLPLQAATVAKPQCRALTFARTLPDYPRFSLGMKLNNANLVSGESLEGAITDVRGRKVHLVVVDDEGLVQQIDDFLQPRVSSTAFSVAVSVRNQVVPTAQMLIALAVERPLKTVTSANQTLAEQFFAAVTEELAATDQRADIAIVSFYLRSAE